MPSITALSKAVLFQRTPSSFATSSCHLLLGRSLDLYLLLGCHSVQCLVHLLCFSLPICPAYFHFCFGVNSMMSVVFVLVDKVCRRKYNTTVNFPLGAEETSPASQSLRVGENTVGMAIFTPRVTVSTGVTAI